MVDVRACRACKQDHSHILGGPALSRWSPCSNGDVCGDEVGLCGDEVGVLKQAVAEGCRPRFHHSQHEQRKRICDHVSRPPAPDEPARKQSSVGQPPDVE